MAERTASARGAARTGRDDEARVTARDLASCAGFAVRLAWRADRRRFVELMLTQIGAAAGLTFAILLVRDLFGDVLGPGAGAGSLSAGRLVAAIGIMVALGSAGGVLRIIGSSRQRVLAVAVDRHVVDLVLGAAARAELPEFEDPDFHDRLQRAVFASRSQPVVVVTTMAAGLQAVLSVAAVAVAFLVMAWWLLPFALLSALPMVRAARAERDAGYGLHLDLAEERRRRQYLEQLLTGRDEAKEVRALGLGAVLRARWNTEYADEIRRTAELQGLHVRRKIGARLGGDLVTAGLVGAVGWLVYQGSVDLATAGASLTALWLLTGRVQMIGALLNGLGASVMYLRDLRGFAARSHRPALGGAAGAGPFTELRADGIGFGYPGSPGPVLSDVSVTLRAGEVVALVGANGSGKTTLAKLLGGLYEPDTGRLLRDGAPVPDPAALRESTALVFQDFVRYKFPAVDNIALGRPELPADRDRAAEAAAKAGAGGFLGGLPRGMDTVLSKEFTDGTDLSLGQWQRLAIARAFYRDSPFVILDEPTASMDPQAEADLFARIHELFAGRTVLLISHRFSTVRGADRIYVLDRGRVIEEGDHASLIAAEGTYARLYRLQADAYRDPAPAGPAPDGGGRHPHARAGSASRSA